MKDNKTLIEKAIVILITFQVAINLGFELYYYYLPHWLEELSFPSAFDFTRVLSRLLTYISAGFVMAGVIKLIEAKEIKLLKIHRNNYFSFNYTQ